MNLRPIDVARPSLADEAYHRITDAMLTGQIPPGARLVMDVSGRGIADQPDACA